MTTLTSEQEENHDNAMRFLVSFRGRYIIGQALYYAIKEMESVEPEIHQEKSNIEDMKYLRDELFNFPEEMFSSQAVNSSLFSALSSKGIPTLQDLTFEEADEEGN